MACRVPAASLGCGQAGTEGGGEAALAQKRRGGSAGAGNAQPELGMGALPDPWSMVGWRSCPTGAFGVLGAAMGWQPGEPQL